MTIEMKKPGVLRNLILTGQFTRLVVYLAAIIPAIIFIICALLVQLGIIHSINLGPMRIGTSLDFILFAIFLGTGTFGIYEFIRLRRVRKIDERFPDFVRDLAEARRAGMTFTKAIMYASKGNYGVLTSEIKKISQQISWGSSVEDALASFAKRVNTKLIRRTVSLIIEASRSGGSVADVLDAASRDARELRLLEAERRGSMMSYVAVIYVGMGVFLLIIAILCGSLIPAMTGEGAKGLSTAMGGKGLITKGEIIPVFFYANLSQSIGMGLVTGVFEEGNMVSGIKHIFIMSLVTWIVFKFLIGM
jgi:archaeal flagellar protein FlaJ